MDTGGFVWETEFCCFIFFKQSEVSQELPDSLKISHFLHYHLPDAQFGVVQLNPHSQLELLLFPALITTSLLGNLGQTA